MNHKIWWQVTKVTHWWEIIKYTGKESIKFNTLTFNTEVLKLKIPKCMDGVLYIFVYCNIFQKMRINLNKQFTS